MAERILVIDDEPQITRVLRTALAAQGYDVRVANDPEEGLRTFEEWSPDLLITDLMMPGMTGIELCRTARRTSKAPILVLSVRDQERSKIEALDAGADDYVTKPFGIQELLARVRAHLRRAPERVTDAPIEVGDFVIDVGAHTILLRGQPIHLTPKEFDLLRVLARNRGRLMTHRELLTTVWGVGYAQDTQVLRAHVANLRRKIEPAEGPRYIKTDPGVGYRFAA